MDSDMMDVDMGPIPDPAPSDFQSNRSAIGLGRAPSNNSNRKVQWVAPPTENVFTVQDGRWIVGWWGDHDCTPEVVEAFLSRWPPSRTPKAYAAWIAVQRDPSPHNPLSGVPTPTEAEKDVPGLQNSFDALLATQDPRALTVSALDELSKRHNVVVGKWLVFVKSHQADRIWGSIMRYICHERKVGQAKIAAREDGENLNGDWERDDHTICVYVDNYLDLQEVKRVREGLRKVGITWRIGFKPDAYTYLGIYARNEWGLRPTRYYDDEL
ncbi:DUF1917-domain-containing protein [Pluteus cervinus]|uniref:DUF1917-domain-containing protein n=1 Tax=Pluteus cervinus TaxID=181527 RepID=A0ACD3AM08_9AGAR|nr:DUF1917-domain-containing protein [Pluteus cervinus]